MSLWQEKKECTKKQKWEAGGEVLAVGGKVCSQNSVKTSCNIKKTTFENICSQWIIDILLNPKFLEYKLQNNMVRKVGVSYVSSCAISRSRLTTGNRTGVNPKYRISFEKVSDRLPAVMNEWWWSRNHFDLFEDILLLSRRMHFHTVNVMTLFNWQEKSFVMKPKYIFSQTTDPVLTTFCLLCLASLASHSCMTTKPQGIKLGFEVI